MKMDSNGNIALTISLICFVAAVVVVALVVNNVASNPKIQDDINSIGRKIDESVEDIKSGISSAVSNAIGEIAATTETAYSKMHQYDYNVYVLKRNNEVFYVAITNNLARRNYEHKSRFDPGIVMTPVASNISLSKVRVIETGLIAFYSTENNIRKGISNKRYNRELLLNKIESDILLY